MKFAGPTKKMMQALEDEGLNIRWPDPGTVKDTETLAIEGTFYTGCTGQWEKLVMIDLRNEGDLSTKSNVDAAISNQLDEAYENFSVDETQIFCNLLIQSKLNNRVLHHQICTFNDNKIVFGF